MASLARVAPFRAFYFPSLKQLRVADPLPVKAPNQILLRVSTRAYEKSLALASRLSKSDRVRSIL